MQKNQRAVVETLTADTVQQAGHGLAGVHRVEQQAFLAGHQLDCRQRSGIRCAVARSEIFVPQLDLETGRQGNVQHLGGALGQTLDFRALGFVAARHGDANHRQVRQGVAQTQGQAAVRAGAAGSEDHGGEIQTGVLDLLGQFQAGADVAQRADRARAANRHQIGFFPAVAQACGEGVQLLVGVIEVFHQFDLGVEQVQQ